MGFFDKIWKWMGKAFSFVDHIVSVYEEIKERLPGLLELIEDLYDNFRPKVEDPNDPMTGEEAATLLVDEVEVKFTNSPLSIPRSFIKYVLEIVHMRRNLDMTAYYDRGDIRAQANRVLRGLRNKYNAR